MPATRSAGVGHNAAVHDEARYRSRLVPPIAFGHRGARANGRDKTPRYQAAIGELTALVTIAEGIRSGAMADILRRDERDSRRETAPLKAAPDAHLLDTTRLGIDAAFRAAIDIVEAVRAGRVRG